MEQAPQEPTTLGRKIIACPCGNRLSVLYETRCAYPDSDNILRTVWEWWCESCGQIFHEPVRRAIKV